MIVTFRSPATESVMMFGDIAETLLKMMGATGRIPGALLAEDVPAALARLEREIQALKASESSNPAPTSDGDEESDDEKPKEPPISIVTRAAPLIDMLKRAVEAKKGVVWEAQ
jgi:hypothetical protein